VGERFAHSAQATLGFVAHLRFTLGRVGVLLQCRVEFGRNALELFAVFFYLFYVTLA
jgi:hypothetical protein